jgi:1,6-anhydro-N-acetylmuramate kinase
MTSAIPFPATVIGLMSGTSADGVDAAILRTDGRAVVEAGASLFMPYDDGLRADILALMRGVGDEADVARRLTDVHILAVRELLKQTKIKADLVGFHGQTIRHAPAEGITVQIGDAARMARELGIPVVADFRSADVKAGGQGAPLVPLYHAALAHALPKPLMVVNIGGVSNVTWIGEGEAGDASPLAGEATRLSPTTSPTAMLVVADNLRSDVVGVSRSGEGASSEADTLHAPPSNLPPQGGEASPVAPLSQHFDNAVAAALIAFDSGPGNALLDDWVFKHTGQRYDKDGAIAARGVADDAVVREFLAHPFFLADAPKSLDRNQFDGVLEKLLGVIPSHDGDNRDTDNRDTIDIVSPARGSLHEGHNNYCVPRAVSLEDGAATLTAMTATSIALSFGAVPAAPKQVLICGGGRKNAHLMGLLKACVNAPVDAVEAVGWDGDMLEAQAFAYLAARSVQGLPLSLPTTTGVREAVSGGVLHQP